MKSPRFLAVGALLLALVVAGCGSTKKAETTAQVIVQNCTTKADFLTSAGRQKIASCIAPSGHEVAFEHCAIKTILGNLPALTHKEREHILQGLVVCLEKNR